MNLWRILCKTRDEAETVLAAAKRDLTIPKYNELAREHSIDKATNLRGGNLGFVCPDGTSNEAGLKVDPALVKAAVAVKDGELVAQSRSPEASGFAVVWRRSTVPATQRTVEDADGADPHDALSRANRAAREEAHRRSPREERTRRQRGPPQDHRASPRSTPAHVPRSISNGPTASGVGSAPVAPLRVRPQPATSSLPAR